MQGSDIYFSHTDDDGYNIELRDGYLTAGSRDRAEVAVLMDEESARNLAAALTLWADLQEPAN